MSSSVYFRLSHVLLSKATSGTSGSQKAPLQPVDRYLRAARSALADRSSTTQPSSSTNTHINNPSKLHGKSTSKAKATYSTNIAHNDDVPQTKDTAKKAFLGQLVNNSLYLAKGGGRMSSTTLPTPPEEKDSDLPLQGLRINANGAVINSTNSISKTDLLNNATISSNTFFRFPLAPEVQAAIASVGVLTPTALQSLVIPKLLAGRNVSVTGQTGSGKTLSYLIPMVQRLISEDKERLCPHPGGRVRGVVLVPSRELAQQVGKVLRAFPVRSLVSAAGSSFNMETRQFRDGVDIAVATPARLLLHVQKQHVSFSQLKCLVMDEADTLATACYVEDVVKLLAPIKGLPLETHTSSAMVHTLEANPQNESPEEVAHRDEMQRREHSMEDKLMETDRHKRARKRLSHSKAESLKAARRAEARTIRLTKMAEELSVGLGDTSMHALLQKQVQVAVVSATKTGALADFLRRHMRQDPLTLGTGLVQNEWLKSEWNALPAPLQSFVIEPVVAADAHLTASSVTQNFIPLRGATRKEKLLEVLAEPSAIGGKSVIFCNSIRMAKRVDVLLKETGIPHYLLTGESDMKTRKKIFAEYGADQSRTKLLVTTGVLSHGIDMPGINHVILYDFPMTMADYLHRIGRTGRAGQPGKVTAFVAASQAQLMPELMEASRAAAPINFGLSTKKIRKLTSDERQFRESVRIQMMKRSRIRREAARRNKFRRLSHTSNPAKKQMQKMAYFKAKALKELERLKSHGKVPKEMTSLPRRANVARDEFNQMETNKLSVRASDGLLQVVPELRGTSTLQNLRAKIREQRENRPPNQYKSVNDISKAQNNKAEFHMPTFEQEQGDRKIPKDIERSIKRKNYW